MRIGILFGGKSREREVSFAGGRTVYDALDKSIFQPIPIFVDGNGNFIELDWPYLYKGTIRDFYPPAWAIPSLEQPYQVYAESLPPISGNPALWNGMGRLIAPQEMANKIDLAFLALHGPYGEDGSIQGLLDFYGIPYTGSGVFPSSVGISKAVQKKLMKAAGFLVNDFVTFSRQQFDQDPMACYQTVVETVGFPAVAKASSQGSSIGVHFIMDNNYPSFVDAMSLCLFRKNLQRQQWVGKPIEEKADIARALFDLQHGLGLPVIIEGKPIHLHHEAIDELDTCFARTDTVLLESMHGEHHVVVESLLRGKEFSCIVLRDPTGLAVALPPTEIRKSHPLFDYRSKYLPGMTRKVTPIETETANIQAIRQQCVRLFNYFEFNVYARIDGFLTESGEVFLNDPNTTSGMMPSSFFFHQAAEIGLNPTQFLSYLVHQSLAERNNHNYHPSLYNPLRAILDHAVDGNKALNTQKMRVAVVFGGYSSERHISVESGRNVYEKLSSSGKYQVTPVFLTRGVTASGMALYELPVGLMLKDNADDIAEKIAHFNRHPVLDTICQEALGITTRFATANYSYFPKEIPLETLPNRFDFVFLALHGRPGEDGTIQGYLDAMGMPYNGSGPESSALTIDKYATNELLASHGVRVARHRLVHKRDWLKGKQALLAEIELEFGYPFVAKPSDDGCSSAVKKIRDRASLEQFAHAIFRDSPELGPVLAQELELKPNEEFPNKTCFLIEELIGPRGASRFIEVTGGMLLGRNSKGELVEMAFEASEAVADGGILSLEEKFLAGEGQNITPARYADNPGDNALISAVVKQELLRTAKLTGVEGYCRIDAFVRIFDPNNVEVIVIEINSLPGLTPATAIFHQAALAQMKPAEFLGQLIDLGMTRKNIPYGQA
ncbi:MAG: D-alanine--D-alanine ligase [Bacteroidetes bacterium]|nr:D-alanine--D-alanine ligase [Bacteroidota bacterium]